jgi:hypothetical protein
MLKRRVPVRRGCSTSGVIDAGKFNVYFLEFVKE